MKTNKLMLLAAMVAIAVTWGPASASISDGYSLVTAAAFGFDTAKAESQKFYSGEDCTICKDKSSKGTTSIHASVKTANVYTTGMRQFERISAGVGVISDNLVVSYRSPSPLIRNRDS